MLFVEFFFVIGSGGKDGGDGGAEDVGGEGGLEEILPVARALV